ncbi:YwqG family protein [Capilliphycus salinus ALCB114379]|uniref:YwqG family protein n=1 Tax=Capilliphycus salinus TaxID=2768948 RepID=UPI0039A6702A
MSNDKIKEDLPAILERYRDRIEATIKPYLSLNLTPDENLTWWQSKFAGREKSPGGFPYLPKGFDYPQTSDGEYLLLLAQINFAEVPYLEGFPTRGILQFYIADNDSYGFSNYYCELNYPQSNWRVIYFPEPDLNAENLITDFDFLPEKYWFETTELEITKCSAIRWTKKYAPICLEDDSAYKLLLPQIGEAVPFELEDLYEEFTDAYLKILDNDGWFCPLQMGGYSCYFSDDPRVGFSEEEDPFDTLLLKISLIESGSLFFYIQSSALAKCDFSKVLYAMA